MLMMATRLLETWKKVQVKHEKMTIPVYKNKRQIDEGTELLWEPLPAARKKSKVKK